MRNTWINEELKLKPQTNLVINVTTGEEIHLEPRLIRILQLLAANKGNIVSRKFLIKKIWNNYASGEELLTHSISILRKKLGKQVISTIPKTGYLINETSTPKSYKVLKFEHYLILIFIFITILRVLIPIHH